jgi:carbonic anhydrase
VAREELTLSGWVYDIGTGEVRISENGERAFHCVSRESAKA